VWLARECFEAGRGVGTRQPETRGLRRGGDRQEGSQKHGPTNSQGRAEKEGRRGRGRGRGCAIVVVVVVLAAKGGPHIGMWSRGWQNPHWHRVAHTPCLSLSLSQLLARPLLLRRPRLGCTAVRLAPRLSLASPTITPARRPIVPARARTRPRDT